MNSLAIVGVGLVGGSIARAVRAAAPGCRLVAVDVAGARDELVASGLFAEVSCDPAPSDLARALGACELVLASVPVSTLTELLPTLLDHAPVVTDVGSTKRAVLGAVSGHPRREHFVPGHPMAGGPDGGFAESRADLFRGRPWIVCSAGSNPVARDAVLSLVRLVGACAVEMSAAEHDRGVAVTSHVPQLLASALLDQAGRLGGAARARGPAFERLTSGGGGHEMWRDVLRTNADEVAGAARELGVQLSLLADALERDPPDVEPAMELLARARAVRGRLGVR
ncbi:MAG: prephenate dehydrogenase/arogenate dehydrogenase family protein [Polyangiaceae bacterium]|nr:prephenate dehydrogenase/arogenate dehydrogenase family protein [Polyangiaceae bacterium]